MSANLKGRVALVTGGTSGIGATIVKCFANAGATGLVLDLAEPPDALPSGWRARRGDVCREEDLAQACSELAEQAGRLDIVVANAGVVPGWRETEHIDLAEWDRVFAVNVKGVMATIKHALPYMKPAGGSIIVLGSLNSRRAHARQCLYAATKHAVLGIVRATALDLGRYGIRVNAIGPGPVATDALVSRLQTRAAAGQPPPEEMLESYANDTALGRIATEDDVASVALFLAGTQSSAISGRIIPVDGGLP
jgi:NAD(P)-dependent dehydrogenase (short-subunit alcohol dehydrogenase family)